MVTIIDYRKRENLQGENFFSLILQGEVCLVQSKTTGMMYATALNTSIPSTFNETTCKSLIGKQLPGIIRKVECESYEYKIKETGETILLEYKYVYSTDVMENEEAISE